MDKMAARAKNRNESLNDNSYIIDPVSVILHSHVA